MRLVCLFTLMSVSCCVLAQDKEVVITEKGVTTNVGKDDARNIISKTGAGDSISRVRATATAMNRKLDSLKALDTGLGQFYPAVRRIYSDRAIKAIYDSLGINRLPKLPAREWSEEELLHFVNTKFSSSDAIGKKDSLMQRMPSDNEFSTGRLTQSALAELAPLSGQVMKSKYFSKLDSIRNVNLKAQGLQLKEEAVSEFRRPLAYRRFLNSRTRVTLKE